eukprot:14841324-Heterocapsa_arctica.AAC.1
MVKNALPPELNKVTGNSKKRLLANLNRFKVFLRLPIAIDLNNLLAYKGKGTYDGKKPPDKKPWTRIKYIGKARTWIIQTILGKNRL